MKKILILVCLAISMTSCFTPRNIMYGKDEAQVKAKIKAGKNYYIKTNSNERFVLKIKKVDSIFIYGIVKPGGSNSQSYSYQETLEHLIQNSNKITAWEKNKGLTIIVSALIFFLLIYPLTQPPQV